MVWQESSLQEPSIGDESSPAHKARSSETGDQVRLVGSVTVQGPGVVGQFRWSHPVVRCLPCHDLHVAWQASTLGEKSATAQESQSLPEKAAEDSEKTLSEVSEDWRRGTLVKGLDLSIQVADEEVLVIVAALLGAQAGGGEPGLTPSSGQRGVLS